MATASGPQVLMGTQANDSLIGGSGNDSLDGGAGSDTLNASSGNDLLVYNVTQNANGSKDIYTGGSGIDTLALQFTLQQWLDGGTQAQIASYLAHQTAVTNRHTAEISNSTASDFVFTFGSSSLTMQMTEQLRAFVGGVELDAVDQLVVSTNDAAAVGEDDPSTNIHVLSNDHVPDLVKSIAVATGPSHGAVNLMKPDATVPSSWYFNYAPDSSHYQYLSKGQSATDTFTYRVTDADGDSSISTVTVTMTGSNDAVTITSSTQSGSVKEDIAGTPSGTITFSDIDLADDHLASFSKSSATALGTFALAPVSEAAGSATGSVAWTYTLDHDAAQYLGAGETAQEAFTVTLDDSNGSTASQDVTITITGTNDAIVITSGVQQAGIAEDGLPGTAAGSIAFDDADLTDEHTVGFTSLATKTHGLFELGTVDEAAGTRAGTVGWTYTLDQDAVQYLGAGETAVDVFMVELDDANGSTTTQPVTMTITGTNDDVVIAAGEQAGSVVEDGIQVAEGTISFSDADLTDAHTASITAAPSQTLGTFSIADPSDTAESADGTLAWDYELDNVAAQAIAAGVTVTETYTVSITDGTSTATKDVTISITGTNDDVFIAAGAQAGSVVEDGVQVAEGTITFSDADLTDAHTASVTAAPLQTLGTFSIGDPSDTAESADGTLAWEYELDNAAAQAIAAGVTVTETYTVSITDGTSTATKDVTISITGTNDDVLIAAGEQAGSVVEDGVQVAEGTISFSDADLTDAHTASVTAAPSQTLGTFSIGDPSDTAESADGTLAWDYELDNVAAQAIAAGVTVTETYTVSIADGTSTATKDVTVSITGVNDDVLISAGEQAGSVVEDGTQVAEGTTSFSDADLTDAHTALVTAAPAQTLGTFSIGDPSDTAESADGTLAWEYELDNAAAQAIAAGVTVTETYTVSITDGTSTATRDVTISITGTNDAVLITSAPGTGAVKEDGSALAAGTIAFSDADLSDSHTRSVTSSNPTALGTFALGAIDESAGTHTGTVGWTYSIDNAAVQQLAAGQSVTETYTVEVADGHGLQASTTVAITIEGANDDVSFTSAPQSDTVAEDGVQLASGSLSFTDADLIDTHTTSVASSNSTALGTFALVSVSESATTANGSVGWTYTLANPAAQYLAAGQSVVETYTVSVRDASGSTASQVVSLTISGTNDAPTVTSATSAGTVAEDGTLAATGTINFHDVDLTDTHTAVVSALSNATSLGSLSLGDVSELAGAAAGSVGWTYNLNNSAAQYLAAGQSVTENYRVTLTDNNGLTVTQDVAITITGAADTPLGLAIVVDGIPSGNGLPSGPIAHFVGSGGSGSGYTYSMPATNGLTLVGDDLIGSLSAGQVYSLNVTVSDGYASYLEQFNIITGTNDAQTLNGALVDDVIYALNSTGGTDIVIAGAGDDWLFGQAGKDELRGGTGNDRLHGGAADDLYLFDTALNALTNVDAIAEFDDTGGTNDFIGLRTTIFAVTAAGNGTLAASNFASNSGGNATTAAQRILYDTSTGNLYYDADGVGAGEKVLFATLVGKPATLDAGDFLVNPGPTW